MSKPCKRGHTGPRYAKGGWCIECAKLKHKENYVPRIRGPRKPQIPTGKKARLPDGRRRSDVPEYLLLWGAKHRARKKNLEFSLELDDIIIPTHCPIFKIPMVSPSIDRISCDRGYTKDNIRIVCKRANILKSNATLAELELLLEDARRIGTP